MRLPYDHAYSIISRCLSKYTVVVNRLALYIPMYDCAKSTLDDHGGVVNSFLLFNSAAPLIDITAQMAEWYRASVS